MLTPVVKRLEKQDVEICKAFASIIREGKFEIKGDAVQKCGALFSWFSTLDKRIEETLKPVKLDGEIKQLEENTLVEAPKKKAK